MYVGKTQYSRGWFIDKLLTDASALMNDRIT
jgi:hypothetical protein